MPSTRAVSEITRMLGCSAPARIFPATTPSMRKPSTKCTSPSILMPWAIGLLIGGCFLRENIGKTPGKAGHHGMSTPRRVDRHGLRGAHGGSVEHARGHGFYHGMGPQIEQAPDAAVLPDLHGPPLAGEVLRPGPAALHAGELQFQPPVELGRIARGLYDQCLPAQLYPAQHFG